MTEPPREPSSQPPTQAPTQPVRRTALYETHAAAGARLIDFAGWEMPVWYSSATDEHHRVRSAAGLFDLGHMGELFIEGPDAASLLDCAVLVNATAMAVGRARYSMLCAPDGGILDDLIVYRLGDLRFMVVANASNAAVVGAELVARGAGLDADVLDETDAWSLIAVQGPRSAEIVDRMVDLDLSELKYYRIDELVVDGVAGLIARTGYTGEDGFELFVPTNAAPALWSALAKAGEPAGLAPVGLAARDTLRLEAGMPLYGNELTTETTPFDVGAGRLVKLDGPDFIGFEALRGMSDGPHRHLVGLHVDGRRPARAGYSVHLDDQIIGAVTSGALSPTYERLIAIASVDRALSPGTSVTVEVRGSLTDAKVVELPFHHRQ